MDSIGSPIVSLRQLDEGIAEASFSMGGARLTGNQELSNAPTVVLLGDSYVVAREVGDAQTTGAWIERLARSDGWKVNVRQYGWRGATPAQYIASAPDVIGRWRPEQVVVLLSIDDLDQHPLVEGNVRLRIGSTGVARMVGQAIEPAQPRSAGALRSSLLLL